MAEPICEDEGLLQEWSPLTQLLQKIPLKVQKGLFPQNLSLTCLDVISEYIVLGTNSHIVYWYSRINGELQRLRLENSQSEVTCVKVVSTVDHMVAAGTNQGTIVVFQIPKVVPESIPDQLKPKKNQIERFTINGLHSVSITNIEWSQNGMKLFSGDKNGLVVLTEIDFAMHLSKSVELINEHFEIVQLSYTQQLLLISTVYRSVVCDGTDNWKVHQVGTKERKILGKFGATFCKFNHGIVLYACRPGYRLWLADKSGTVQQTLIFKSAVQSTCPKIQLINPVDKKRPLDINFGKILQYTDSKLIAYNADVLYVLHPGAVSVTSVLYNVRKILDLAVNDNEIFILEGERSLLRISPVPDKYSTEMNCITNCRKSTFNLDDLAAKLKDTAMGSIKKITKDFMPELMSPNSPPVLADDALELPPIVYLPDGILCEKIQIESPINNNNGFNQVFENHGSSFSHNLSHSPPFNEGCQEDIITRPLRKRRNKHGKKTLLPAQVFESESDTTSNASDDRLTWGVTNDMSLSDESAMTQSNSSFSVLRDISTVLTQASGEGDNKIRELTAEEIMTLSDCKSQTSLDTCESVSECLMTNSEKFREEQERTFARLANQSLLNSFNSEKTDEMSISLNTANSSSIISEYSDNASSLASRTKTTESQTYDDQRYTPADLNDHYETGSQKDETAEEIVEFPESLKHSTEGQEDESHFNPRNHSDENGSAQSESFNNLHITDVCSTDNERENCSLGFGIKKIFEFHSRDEFNHKEDSFYEMYAKDNLTNGEERSNANANMATEQPLSYDTPSGSSLSNFKSNSSDFLPTTGTTNRTKICDSSDHWLLYKIPEPVTSLSVSRKYVMCVDINDRVYYACLSGLGLSWTLLDYKASAIRVSLDGSVVWLADKKSVYSLVNPEKSPIVGDLTLIALDVLSFAIDDKNNGWVVTSKGRIHRYPYLIDVCGFGEPEEVSCPHLVTDVACSDGTIFVLTVKENLLCKRSTDNEFRLIKTCRPAISSFTLGPDNLLWVVDDKNAVYFSDDFFTGDPRWWQIHISDYVFQNSTASFQNIYSKIKLKNLKGNILSKENVSLIASNDESVWISEKFSTSVRVNKSDFIGYLWSSAVGKTSLSVIEWLALTGEGVFEDKGHVWLLATNGNIFCISPKTDQIQNIPVPCDDDVLCIASAADTLWVLSKGGSIYSRLGLSDDNLIGNSWRELRLPQVNSLGLVWVSCGCDVAWGCDGDGRTFMTIGSPHHMATNIFDAAWVEVEGQPQGIKLVKVFVGPQMYMVWAIDVKGNLYVREGIFSYYQIGTSWVYVGGIEAVHVSISGTSVWALSTEGTIYRRCGISERNYIGDYWKMIPGTFKMMTSSFSDGLWTITRENEIMRLDYRVKVLEKFNSKNKEKEPQTVNEGWEMVS